VLGPLASPGLAAPELVSAEPLGGGAEFADVDVGGFHVDCRKVDFRRAVFERLFMDLFFGCSLNACPIDPAGFVGNI